jgi:DNA repair protein RadC
MDLHRSVRPRERLQASGPAALKDEELLAILLGTGTKGRDVLELSRGVLRRYPGSRMINISFPELQSQKGIGPAKACAVLAAFELSRRLLDRSENASPPIRSAEDALPHLHDIRSKQKEHFVALYLNARNQLIHKECVSVGTLNSSLVHPREVFAPALEHRAAGEGRAGTGVSEY